MTTDRDNTGATVKQPGLAVPPYGLERRRNVRVMPTDDEPIWLCIAGKEYSVTDVSLGGVAFYDRVTTNSRPPDSEGARFVAEIKLPNHTAALCVDLAVLGRTDSGVVRCVFLDAPEEVNRVIDDFVTLRVQTLFADYFS